MMLRNKKYLIAGGLIIAVLIIGFLMLMMKGNNKAVQNKEPLPTEMVIPTVDSSVTVELQPIKTGEVKLVVKDAPKGTQSIEFEISYSTKTGEIGESGEGYEGTFGKCFLVKKDWQCGESDSDGRKIVLGTCSSGVCRYHKINGPVKVVLKFIGDYGEKVFEEDFTI